jgi:hypothetical protein
MEGLYVQGIMHGRVEKYIYIILVGKPEKRDQLECLGLDERILLKC